MPTTCVVCGSDVPISHAVHATVHTKSDAGVIDHYLCRDCYDDRLAPLFEGDTESSATEADSLETAEE